jgi:predicted tellurium resistance membrane protein TerC
MNLELLIAFPDWITAISCLASGVTTDGSLAGNIVANFVEEHPTVKMLAVSFLVMIGAMLVADGCGTHVSKGYVYFAMVFSLLVELLNLRAKQMASRAEVSQGADI